jgi:hypothetical protein
MHTGEPLFGGTDSHDQLFKICRMQGPYPDSLIAKSEKRDKYFTTQPAVESCGGEKVRSLFQIKIPPQYCKDGGCVVLPPLRTLRSIIGVDIGGPCSRRLGEKGHSPEHYEAFLDFVDRMLRMDAEERIRPGEALPHFFPFNLTSRSP